MNSSLAIILAALGGIAVGVLFDVFMWRWQVRDLRRWDREQRRELARPTVLLRRFSPCALRGHKYQLQVDGWRCPVCGDTVFTDDDGGVA